MPDHICGCDMQPELLMTQACTHKHPITGSRAHTPPATSCASTTYCASFLACSLYNFPWRAPPIPYLGTAHRTMWACCDTPQAPRARPAGSRALNPTSTDLQACTKTCGVFMNVCIQVCRCIPPAGMCMKSHMLTAHASARNIANRRYK